VNDQMPFSSLFKLVPIPADTIPPESGINGRGNAANAHGTSIG
jgi:hypothetical protein